MRTPHFDIDSENVASIAASVIDRMGVGLYVLKLEDRNDPTSLRIIIASPASQQFTGLNVSEIVGRRFLEVFPKSTNFTRYYEAIINRRDDVIGRYTYEWPDERGDHHYFLKTFYIGEDMLGISFENITEQVRSEEIALLNARMAALGEMAAGIAHEINNPLAIIAGKAQLASSLLQREPADLPRISRSMGTIEEMVMRISRIVKGMKILARKGERDPFAIVSVADILDDTFSLCRERFRSSGIQIEFAEVEREVGILCRAPQITQVLINLLNNAFDAVAKQPDCWVKVDVQAKDSIVIISVTDSGRGVGEAIREKIMQPFFTTKEPGKGTGLGLSISRGIIEEHHGTLVLDRNSVNTRFVITLPKQHVAAD